MKVENIHKGLDKKETKIGSFFCRIGIHDMVTAVTAYEKCGVGDCGKVQYCLRCGKVEKTGEAIIPDWLKG